jgi:hypothetical protein
LNAAHDDQIQHGQPRSFCFPKQNTKGWEEQEDIHFHRHAKAICIANVGQYMNKRSYSQGGRGEMRSSPEKDAGNTILLVNHGQNGTVKQEHGDRVIEASQNIDRVKSL